MRFLLLGLIFFFTACYVNERGISANYYNDCKAYYDAAGVYHKACDENIIDFSDAKKLVGKKQSEADMALAAAKSEEQKELGEIDKLEAQFEKEEAEKKAWQQRVQKLEDNAKNAAKNNIQEIKEFDFSKPENQSELRSNDF